MAKYKQIAKRLKTEITFNGAGIVLDEIDVNLLDFWMQPTLPREGDNYDWEWDVSIGTDTDAEEEHDILTCYLNGDMMMKGQPYFIIKINTLHSYLVPKLKYKMEHEELYKNIARESVVHANLILAAAAKGTEFEGFQLPPLDEYFLEDDARDWNKRGYIRKPSRPDEKSPGRKMSPEEITALIEEGNKLVAWIDAFDEEKPQSERSQEEMHLYYTKYAEYVKLNNTLSHYRLIARNKLAYMTNKIMVAMEKAVEAKPDDYLLKEAYEEMKDNYLSVMEQWKDEFAKN